MINITANDNGKQTEISANIDATSRELVNESLAIINSLYEVNSDASEQTRRVFLGELGCMVRDWLAALVGDEETVSLS